MNGELERAGERWRLRFTRTLPHSPDKMWRAITEPEHLKAWFPDQIVADWTVGATLRFIMSGGPDFDGKVREVDPPHALEFTWGPDLLRFELAPAPEGCTLTLLDTFDEVGKAARDGAGWHVCLDALERELSGAGADVPTEEAWKAVHSTYVARFGPDAATIGPPEGWDE